MSCTYDIRNISKRNNIECDEQRETFKVFFCLFSFVCKKTVLDVEFNGLYIDRKNRN